MENTTSQAQPVPANNTVRGGWDQGMERGFKKQIKDVWEKLDDAQKWSLYAVIGLGALLLLLILGFGVRDLVVTRWLAH